LSRRRLVLLSGLTAVLVIAAVLYRYYGPTGPGTARTSQSGASKGGAVAAPVSTALAQIGDFAVRRRTIGIIESPATVVVKSRIESQVVEQHVKDGQLVRKGDLLFSLDDREIIALIARDEAQLAKDQATVVRTATDEDRYRQLSASTAGSRQQLDQAVADHKIAQANVAADEAQLRSDKLRLAYTRIEAPIGGRVGAVRVTPGNLVSVNDPTGLVTITQIRPIRVAFTLAERDLPELRKAARGETQAAVRVYTPGMSEPLAAGVLEFVDSAVDTASGTIAAKARFANDNFVLWPGMYVDVEIDLAVRPKTVLIPTVAVQAGQKGPFVFVVNQGKAEMRPVEFVGTEGDHTALASGVNAGERVIVEGQMRLVGGTPVADAAQPDRGNNAGNAGGSQPAADAKAQK
jgi:membrane fusion protein, multidrug efflux system